MNGDIYLSLDKKQFDSKKLKALKDAKDEFGEEEDEQYLFSSLTLESNEFSFDGNELYISGELEGLGYLSMTLPLSTDDAITFIEEYVKKMNKIKTILEAAK